MKNKKIRNYILIILLVLTITIVGVSFAYFTSNVTNNGEDTKVNTQISNRANLEFTNGSNLSINASMDNFHENGDNLSSSSTSTATLTIDANESYTAKYYVYFNIFENEFVHTTEDAELLLKIEGPDGEINTIEGLSYVTSGGETGFDITEEKGLIKVSVPEEITATNVTASEDWTFTLFFINLDSNQNANAGKTFESKIILSKEEVNLTFAEEIVVLAGNGQVVHETFVDATSPLADSKGIVDTGYRYEGANPDNYVTFNNETWRIIGAFDTEVANTDGTHTTEKLVKIVRKDTLGEYSWDNSNTGDGVDYNNNWPTSDLFHLLNESYLNAENGTNGVAENSYCWSGESSAGTCDFTNSGIQDNSRDMIEKVKWNLGGVSYTSSTSSVFYKLEKGTNVSDADRATEVDAHIGLIYISDYGFSALENTCSRDLEVYNYYTIDECHDENWLFGDVFYWSIVPYSSYSILTWTVDHIGNVFNNDSFSMSEVAPVLYLKSDVMIDRGVGTESDPYILK